MENVFKLNQHLAPKGSVDTLSHLINEQPEQSQKPPTVLDKLHSFVERFKNRMNYSVFGAKVTPKTACHEPAVLEADVTPEKVRLEHNIAPWTSHTAPGVEITIRDEILKKINEYSLYHENDPLDPTEAEKKKIADWDAQFLSVHYDVLFEIIIAAEKLNITPLLHLGCNTVGNMIKGKSVEEIRTMFNIANDFTPEEEEEFRRAREREWDDYR